MTRNRGRKIDDRPFYVLLVLVTVLVWTYLLVFSVRLESREEMKKEFLLDNSGAPVEVYRSGRVWELGKGYREPTQEEREFEGDRP